MDKTTVFDNESIWVFEQIMEPLYTVSKDGKTVVPWLATSYTLSPDKKTYTFTLRKGVKFSNGQPMTSADVKFSIDAARVEDQGWGFLDVAIKDIETPDPETVVIHTKYPWSPFLADIALFANGIIPKDYGGETKKEFYTHPVGTGPFMWDHWDKGSELVLKKNPNYWQKGKPYLDSVTWTTVGDDNTRELQLKGGQAQIDEFPPSPTMTKLQNTPGVKMTLFPSTRTDYMMMNETLRSRLDDVHVRRAISLAIDREAIVKSVLFAHGNRRTRSCRRRCRTTTPTRPASSTTWTRPSRRWPSPSTRTASTSTCWSARARPTSIDRPDHPAVARTARHQGRFHAGRPGDRVPERAGVQVQLGFSYWTMDIADPDELVTFAVDPNSGAKSFYTDYSNADVIKLDAPGRARVRKPEAAGAVLQDPGAGGERRLHGVPVLLAVPLRVHEQGQRLLRLPDGQLPHGGRLALEVAA